MSQKLSFNSYCNWQFLALFDSFLGFIGFKNHTKPIFLIKGFIKKIQLKIPILRKHNVSSDWQFLAVFDTFLCLNRFRNHMGPVFFVRGFAKKNFSSKFQFLEKNDGSATKGQTYDLHLFSLKSILKKNDASAT